MYRTAIVHSGVRSLVEVVTHAVCLLCSAAAGMARWHAACEEYGAARYVNRSYRPPQATRNNLQRLLAASNVIDGDLDLDAGLNGDGRDLLHDIRRGVQVDQALVDPAQRALPTLTHYLYAYAMTPGHEAEQARKDVKIWGAHIARAAAT